MLGGDGETGVGGFELGMVLQTSLSHCSVVATEGKWIRMIRNCCYMSGLFHSLTVAVFVLRS